ncbi:MAG TPA: hypothetical protein VLB84_18625 [Bacteroidia bacterium]|nr:hypothetical protein [Bacteroidia bacterium]
MPNRVEHTKKALLEALEQSLGVVTSAVKKAGIGRTTFYEYYNSDEEFRKKVDDIGNVSIDFAESQLFKQIKEGNVTAIIFYLKTKGKHRGYFEKFKQEIEHSGDQSKPITIKKTYEK